MRSTVAAAGRERGRESTYAGVSSSIWYAASLTAKIQFQLKAMKIS